MFPCSRVPVSFLISTPTLHVRIRRSPRDGREVLETARVRDVELKCIPSLPFQPVCSPCLTSASPACAGTSGRKLIRRSNSDSPFLPTEHGRRTTQPHTAGPNTTFLLLRRRRHATRYEHKKQLQLPRQANNLVRIRLFPRPLLDHRDGGQPERRALTRRQIKPSEFCFEPSAYLLSRKSSRSLCFLPQLHPRHRRRRRPVGRNRVHWMKKTDSVLYFLLFVLKKQFVQMFP